MKQQQMKIKQIERLTTDTLELGSHNPFSKDAWFGVSLEKGL